MDVMLHYTSGVLQVGVVIIIIIVVFITVIIILIATYVLSAGNSFRSILRAVIDGLAVLYYY